MENETEIITQENDSEEEVELEEVEEEQEEQEESVEQLKKKLATLEAQKEHWREKANKPKEEVVVQNSSLSSSDLLAVMKANVHEDDMERVEKFAKMEGVSIKDALKNPELKAILSLREEQRNTASATNVTNVRRGSVKMTDEQIIANAQAGKLPEDDDAIARLVAAKRKLK